MIRNILTSIKVGDLEEGYGSLEGVSDVSIDGGPDILLFTVNSLDTEFSPKTY